MFGLKRKARNETIDEVLDLVEQLAKDTEDKYPVEAAVIRNVNAYIAMKITKG